MFKGNWVVNIISACFAFIIVFSASFYNNLISTTIIRASIAFVIFYLLAYLFRWLAFLAFTTEENPSQEGLQLEETLTEEEPLEELGIDNNEIHLAEEDVMKTSQYVKDLLDNEEG